MYQINNEKFGQFLSEIRKEKSMTQKELADKLFVSDKTVSKWERGNSLPNVTLLVPIADVFGITVTELLKGEKISGNKSLSTDEVEDLIINSLDLSVRNTICQRKKNLIFAFLISIGVVIAEAVLMTVSGITIEQMGDSIYISFLMLIFAICCIFVKEVLPTYYDKDKINFVSQGVFRIHMPGLAFNNGNWIYVLTIFRLFTLGVAVLAPILCWLCISIGGVDLWKSIQYPSILIVLAGLIVATYIVGKKYE
ncbi:helix-turn-helix domain-containing protein [Faecalicoccus acidiformans]|uniref:helix-turn-helix domain-containing protein n=1 Tax=Faecalicoccus acidiformans TaxID=915173 RepID=UPI003208ECE7